MHPAELDWRSVACSSVVASSVRSLTGPSALVGFSRVCQISQLLLRSVDVQMMGVQAMHTLAKIVQKIPLPERNKCVQVIPVHWVSRPVRICMCEGAIRRRAFTGRLIITVDYHPC